MDLTSWEDKDEIKYHSREKNEPKPSNEAMFINAPGSKNKKQKQKSEVRQHLRQSKKKKKNREIH